MGKGAKQTTTTKNEIPQWVSDAGQSNYNFAAQAADAYKPVMQQAPAGFTADQLQAQQMIRDMAGTGGAASASTQGMIDKISDFEYKPQTYEAAKMVDNPLYAQLMQRINSGGPALPQFQSVDAGGFGASAQQVGEIDPVEAERIAAAQMNRGDIRDVTTQMTPEALQQYLAAFDPSYDQAVMDAATNDLERGREIAQQQNRSAAAAAGAFGGSRHGLVEAETNRGFADTLARTSAQLRLQGLDRALQSFQGDQARSLQAQGMNQGQDWNVAQGNASLLQQGNITNAANALEAASRNQSTELSRQSTNAQLGTQANIANAQMGAQAAMANAAARNQFLLQQYIAAAQRAQNGDTLMYDVLSGDTSAQTDANKYTADAGNNAQEFSANYWKSALPNLADVDNDVFRRNVTNVGLLSESGAQQQKYNQAVQDTQYANDLDLQQNPVTQLAIRQSALGATPYSTSSESTTASSRSPWDYITSLGGSAMQAWALSDERKKKNIRPVRNSLLRVQRMEPVEYNWRDDGSPDLGLVAQDVKRAMPGAVRVHDGAMQYSMPQVIGLLTGAVKELDRRTRR